MGQVIERVRVRGGFVDASEAEGALLAVLEAIAPALDGATREQLADALPDAWSLVVQDAPPEAPLDRDGFVRAVAEHERTAVGFGIEHAMAACQALAEHADDDLRYRLRALPRSLGEFFEGHAATEDGPERLPSPHEHEPHRPTLSSARPGPQRPLSEGRPSGGQRHSVAASEDPHGDSRLSSASGVTQERQGRTLAEGKPGSERPLSEDD